MWILPWRDVRCTRTWEYSWRQSTCSPISHKNTVCEVGVFLPSFFQNPSSSFSRPSAGVKSVARAEILSSGQHNKTATPTVYVVVRCRCSSHRKHPRKRDGREKERSDTRELDADVISFFSRKTRAKRNTGKPIRVSWHESTGSLRGSTTNTERCYCFKMCTCIVVVVDRMSSCYWTWTWHFLSTTRVYPVLSLGEEIYREGTGEERDLYLRPVRPIQCSRQSLPKLTETSADRESSLVLRRASIDGCLRAPTNHRASRRPRDGRVGEVLDVATGWRACASC